MILIYFFIFELDDLVELWVYFSILYSYIGAVMVPYSKTYIFWRIDDTNQELLYGAFGRSLAYNCGHEFVIPWALENSFAGPFLRNHQFFWTSFATFVTDECFYSFQWKFNAFLIISKIIRKWALTWSCHRNFRLFHDWNCFFIGIALSLLQYFHQQSHHFQIRIACKLTTYEDEEINDYLNVLTSWLLKKISNIFTVNVVVNIIHNTESRNLRHLKHTSKRKFDTNGNTFRNSRVRLR